MRHPILCLLALAACAPATGTAPATGAAADTHVVTSAESINVSTASEMRVTSAEVAAPVDRVWQVLPAVYQELGLEAQADAAERTVRTQSAVARRIQGEPATRFFDCGRGQFGADIASQYEVRFNARTTVQPGAAAGTARLETGVEAFARNATGSANALLAVCHTRGRLEEIIAARVRARLGL